MQVTTCMVLSWIYSIWAFNCLRGEGMEFAKLFENNEYMSLFEDLLYDIETNNEKFASHVFTYLLALQLSFYIKQRICVTM